MKRFLRDNTELSVIMISFAIFFVLKLALANKFALLNLYYVPVFLSGYYLGKKPAILTSILGVLMAVFFAIRWPAELLENHNPLHLTLNMVLWASFLILVSILFSSLNETRERRVVLATEELLEQYLRQAIESRENHPARVARLAAALGAHMHLPADFIASLEAAALLHDLKESKNGLRLIADSMAKGLAKNRSFGGALPIIMAGEQDEIQPYQTDLAIGAKILAVADVFDSVSTSFRNVAPLQLLTDMEHEQRYSKAVTKALRHLLEHQGGTQNFSPA